MRSQHLELDRQDFALLRIIDEHSPTEDSGAIILRLELNPGVDSHRSRSVGALVAQRIVLQLTTGNVHRFPVTMRLKRSEMYAFALEFVTGSPSKRLDTRWVEGHARRLSRLTLGHRSRATPA